MWTVPLSFWSTYNKHIADCCVDCLSVFLVHIQYTYCRLLSGLSLWLSDPHTIHILQTVVWTVPLSFWSTYSTHIADCCVDCLSVFLIHIQYTYCRLLCGLSLCISGPHTIHILQTVVWTVTLSFWSTYSTHIVDCCVDCPSVIWSTYNTHIADYCVDCPSVFLVHIQYTYCRLLCRLSLSLSGPHTIHILQTVVWTVFLSIWSTYSTHIVNCCVDCPSVFVVHIQYRYCRLSCGLSLCYLVHIQYTYCRLLWGLSLCLSDPHTAHILQTVVWTVTLSLWSTYNTHIVDYCVDCPSVSFWSTYSTHIADCCVDCLSVFLVHIQHTYCRLLCGLSLCLSGPHTIHILQNVVWTVPLSFWSTYSTHIVDCCVDCHSVVLIHIQHTYCRLLCGLSLCLSGPHTAHILQTVVWTVYPSFWSTYNTHIVDYCVDCPSVFLVHIQYTYCRLLCGLSLCLFWSFWSWK